jgi:plastocyanin
MTSKLYRMLSLPAILTASLAVFGCGSKKEENRGGRSVEIVAEEYRFTPSQITAEPGEELTITLRNQGKMEHSIEFEVPGGNEALERNVPPGETGHMSFTAPSKTGTYPFFSPLGDDRKRGLEGRLDVTSRGTTSRSSRR